MTAEIITLNDLERFGTELKADIKKMLSSLNGQPTKKWLKSYEVRKLLDISQGTLQHLRVNGTMPFTKIGGVIYYDHEDSSITFTPPIERETNGIKKTRNKIFNGLFIR